MQVICDIEANSLVRPTKIWCIVCKDIATGRVEIFRNLVTDEAERNRFSIYADAVTRWVGHNFLGYDWPVIHDLLGRSDPDIASKTIDTLIISKLVDYSRKGGHSVEQYGEEFGLEKIKFNTFTHWSQEMEDYCVRDVDITHRIYSRYLRIIDDPAWASSILLEHRFQLVCNDMHTAGFGFNTAKAEALLAHVEGELAKLDEQILAAFPPKEVLIREFTPKLTKFGTISRTSVPRSLADKIHLYSAGQTYRHTRLDSFNPSSHKQIIEVLNEAGWQPEEKTKTHIDTEREINRAKYSRDGQNTVDLKTLSAKLEILKKSGWKVNETNLLTLPETAPPSARFLAKRILLEARRRSLVEWLGLVQDNRIHGKFYGIGAWTHRMAHQQPNTANIPREFKEDGTLKLLGKQLRELWIAPKNRLLVGVDAEGIQLRIFAHYIDDPEFTRALVEGRKDDKTDPHSLNQRILGSACKTRQAAKRFVYALLLGGGIGKLAQILDTSERETKEALDRLLERYTGFKELRKVRIPRDARKGSFIGLDGRVVPIPGDTQRDREHLCMSGYLQCGEAISIKLAAIIIDAKLAKEKELRKWFFVDIVHDELQSEVRNSVDFAIQVAKIKADAIREAGEQLKLKCPLAGSYVNDDTKRNTIGTNWYATH